MIESGAILAAIAGYLFGSVPFGLVLTRMAGYGDIRQIGSGNIGATNVLRTGNKPLAAITLLLDSGKGAIAVLLAVAFLDDGSGIAPLLAGVLAVIGHNFPIWLRFKGGKGVATTLGTLIALSWPIGLACCATWLLMAAVFRISSLSALIALAAAPAYALVPVLAEPNPSLAVGSGVLAALAWIRHHQNIRRLLKGEEPKIGKKKS